MKGIEMKESFWYSKEQIKRDMEAAKKVHCYTCFWYTKNCDMFMFTKDNPGECHRYPPDAEGDYSRPDCDQVCGEWTSIVSRVEKGETDVEGVARHMWEKIPLHPKWKEDLE
jgi:hypothetical protein